MVGMIKGCFGGGTSLPVLDNAASASDVRAGKEFIDGSGNKGTGSAEEIQGGNVILNGSDITLAGGKFLAGNKIIKWDSNITAGNIKNGVSIFGVTGSLTGNNVAAGTVTVNSTSSQSLTISGNWGFTPSKVALVITGITDEQYDAVVFIMHNGSTRRIGYLIDDEWRFSHGTISNSAFSFDEDEVTISPGKYFIKGTYAYLVAE